MCVGARYLGECDFLFICQDGRKEKTKLTRGLLVSVLDRGLGRSCGACDGASDGASDGT